MPLAAAHRFKPMFDFGYVALDILYVYPEDSGTYTLVAKNELGEVESNLELVVHPHKTLYTEPQHPEGKFFELKHLAFAWIPACSSLGY